MPAVVLGMGGAFRDGDNTIEDACMVARMSTVIISRGSHGRIDLDAPNTSGTATLAIV